MKNKILTFVLLVVVSLFVIGCNSEEEVVEKDINLYPVSSYEETLKISLGDVMPFYDNGVMNIYHLQNSRGSNSMFYHPISRLTTTDYITYKDEGITIDFEEEYSSPDAAIGTGSFIKDSDGLYHCFYTGHNGAADTGLPFIEVVRHATSVDQVTWVKDEEFNLYGNCNDFRDPYVYYDTIDEVYYMLVTTRSGDTGVIQRYSTTDLMSDDEGWNDCGVFFYNDNGTYNMECPSYVEFNGFYYLVYSEQGDNRVTHYRYKTEHNGDWKRFERDSIDSSGFYAGRIEKAEDKLYAFAWCANLTGGFVGGFDWGGNLVAHKLIQSSNGELNAVMIDSVYNALQDEVEYQNINKEKVDTLSFEKAEFKSMCFNKLKRNTTRISYSFKLESLKGNFGITLNVKGANNRLGSAVISFDVTNSELACYNNVSNIIRYGSALAKVPFVYDLDRNYTVNILVEEEIMTVYLNNEVALTVRLPGIVNKNFAFYSNGVAVTFENIKFYE